MPHKSLTDCAFEGSGEKVDGLDSKDKSYSRIIQTETNQY